MGIAESLPGRPPADPNDEGAKKGFLAELGHAGISTNDVAIVEGLNNDEKARTAGTVPLDNANAPTAIFSSQDLVTIERTCIVPTKLIQRGSGEIVVGA
ncbi:MAG: hypothetical protein ABI053_09290 [Lacisediminihabitans sp.]